MTRWIMVFCLAFANYAHAATYGVVAVVNDERITNYELVERIDMMISAAKAPNNSKTRQQLRGRALEQLINETLQIQHAKEVGYTVSQKDADKAIAALERRNGLKPGGFAQFLKREKVSRDTVLKQIHAQVLWNKLVGQKFRNKGHVSEAELAEAMKAQKNNPYTYEDKIVHSNAISTYFLKELVFPRNGDDRSVATLAKLVASDVRKGTMGFDEAVKTYATSSKQGGNIGWVEESRLPKELKAFVKKNKKGGVFGPVQTPKDFRIFHVSKQKINQQQKVNKVKKKRLFTKEEMKTRLRNEKISKSVEAYMDQVRSRAYIENRL